MRENEKAVNGGKGEECLLTHGQTTAPGQLCLEEPSLAPWNVGPCPFCSQ